VSPEDFASRVLDWFSRHGRKDLPWQQDPTAYRVWVSEIMLQQTQVATVIPYFQRFMGRFPNLATLAEASLDEVLHRWSGLGYYARARNLQRAAQVVRDRHQGRFPLELERVQDLPGIGRSTAGAILSLAAGQSHAILDGNVKRVLTRCFAVPGWPGETRVAKRLWELAERLTPQSEASQYNQAMMDLGATLCIRARPGCAQCPLSDACVAHLQGNETAYPAPKPRQPLPVRRTHLLLIHNTRGEILLERRPPAGIWGGLWSLPECQTHEDLAGWCQSNLGVAEKGSRHWPSRRHTFSHFHLDILPVEILIEDRDAAVMDENRRVWYKLAEPDRRGLASPVARLLSELKTNLTGEPHEPGRALRKTE
jgi:A/G-specific adenine glycosylase